jgi:hypothetical protein
MVFEPLSRRHGKHVPEERDVHVAGMRVDIAGLGRPSQ